MEIATWNIQNFPKNERKTIPAVTAVIKRWDIDIIGFQELTNRSSFKELDESLEAYKAVISSSFGMFGQGLLYRSEEIEVLSQKDIFQNDRYAFPRPPLQVRLKLKETDQELMVFVVHFKAKSGENESQERRQQANEKMRTYIDQMAAEEPVLAFAIIGDFNSLLSDKEMRVWEDSSGDYEIETRELVERGLFSYPSRQSLIDHIVTRNLNLDDMSVPKPYEDQGLYRSEISDHLPVAGSYQY